MLYFLLFLTYPLAQRVKKEKEEEREIKRPHQRSEFNKHGYFLKALPGDLFLFTVMGVVGSFSDSPYLNF